MALRTTRSVLTFASPFRVEALDDLLPAGTYDIDTEEEIIEGNERTVYIRVATFLNVRTGGTLQIVPVDPKEVDAGRPASGKPHDTA